jgi:hypothetical protein
MNKKKAIEVLPPGMSLTQPAGLFLVMFDNGDYCVPYGNDPDCPGALEANSKTPTVFHSRAAAGAAIRISKLFNRIRKERGEPVNSDFTDDLKHVLIVPLVPYVELVPHFENEKE